MWGEGTNQDMVKVRLSDNPCFTRIVREEPDYFSFDERFWLYADLTGQDIVFAQQTSGWPARAFPAYVKLVPLSDAEVAAIQEERQREDTKTLIGIACEGDDYLGYLRPTTRKEIWEMVEPYRDTDFRKLFWCVGSGGDICTYPTRIGALQNVETQDRSRPFDRVKGEALNILLGKGIDPLEEAVSHAHKLGLEMIAQLRMGAFQAAPPLEGTYTGPAWGRHPEWYCVDIDGREIARMSYAFEGMQDYVLSLLLELAGYDVDGVCMTWVRGAPYVLYEKPLVEGFKAKTGKDPRDLPEDDEEYLRYRAGFMTAFARKVRRAMDERGREARAQGGAADARAQRPGFQPVLRVRRRGVGARGAGRYADPLPMARQRHRRGVLLRDYGRHSGVAAPGDHAPEHAAGAIQTARDGLLRQGRRRVSAFGTRKGATCGGRSGA